MAWMTREGLGLNKFLSLGNKLDVAENEALAYFLEDPGTAAVYVYLEGVEDSGAAAAARPQTRVLLPAMWIGNRGHRIPYPSLTTDEQVVARPAAKRHGPPPNQADFLSGHWWASPG
jgi:hypothetical protein